MFYLMMWSTFLLTSSQKMDGCTVHFHETNDLCPLPAASVNMDSKEYSIIQGQR